MDNQLAIVNNQQNKLNKRLAIVKKQFSCYSFSGSSESLSAIFILVEGPLIVEFIQSRSSMSQNDRNTIVKN